MSRFSSSWLESVTSRWTANKMRRRRLRLELLENRIVPAIHVVRTAYVIPSNRAPQPNAIADIRNHLIDGQRFYADLMERNGFGPKTFRFETEADGVTPKIHIINDSHDDAYFRADAWARTNTAVGDAGLPIWQAGQVWANFLEAHLMSSDGSVQGGVALGASFGSGSNAGVALLGGNGLAMMGQVELTDNSAYNGVVLPDVGPYPAVQDKTFPWFEGTTISSVTSAHRGAALHELGHALGLPHDFRNDANANGNLMGNGLRGFRGWLYPYQYTAHDTYLAYGSALQLNSSRYLNPDQTYTDNVGPTVSAPVVDVFNGQLRFQFTASDASGVAAAFLKNNDGNRIAEQRLSGGSASITLFTPSYTPGAQNSFTATVQDAVGNLQNVTVTYTPAAGVNRGPIPFLQLSRTQLTTSQQVVLNASNTSDPDHSLSTLMFEWDLNGDGTYDTAPSKQPTLSTTFATTGNRLVRVRVTDPVGGQAESAPIAVDVSPAPMVSAVQFGDGTVQRSMVKTVVVTFSTPVTFIGAVGDAFTMFRHGTGGATGNVSLTATQNGAGDVVTLNNFTGSFAQFGSLIDGYWDLTIDANKVGGSNGSLDGVNDTVVGGNYVVIGNTSNKFFRLYGDGTGDGTVNQTDFIAFRNAFNNGASSIFDFEGDGNITQSDFIHFRNRFNVPV